MRGIHRLGVGLAACLAIACGSSPATPSPSATVLPTPDHTAGPPTATPRTATENVPDELATVWEAGGCSATDVAPTVGQRLIMVGFCQSQGGFRSAAWESETAFEWRRTFDTETDVSLWAASPDGRTGGALLGGSTADEVPHIWRGDVFDGFDQDEPARLPTDGRTGLVRAIEWGDGDYLAVGQQATATVPDEPAAWRYVDTGPWEQIDAPPDAEVLVDVIYGPDPLTYTVAGWHDRRGAAVWRLTNGTDWSEPIVLPAGGEEPVVSLLSADTVLGGHALWTEDETGEWQFHPLLSGVDASAGVLLGDGALVFGTSRDSQDNPEIAVLAAGADRHWHPVEIDRSETRKLVHGAVLFEDRVVAVGDAVWMGPDEIEAYLE